MLLQAGRAEELIQLLDQVDLRLIGNALALGQLIQSLPESPNLTEPIRSLYRKIWEAFPEQRVQLLVYVHRDDVWRMPEMYERVRDAIIPAALPARGSLINWYPFMPIAPVTNPTTGLRGTAVIQPPISRFLDLAVGQGRLGEFASDVRAAQKRLPGWAPAHAILTLIHLRTGDYDEARTQALKVFNHFKTDPVDSTIASGLYTLWTTGIELAKQPATYDLAATALEGALASPLSFNSFRFGTDQGPAGRLIELRLRSGRAADARNAIVKMVRTHRFPESYDASMIHQANMASLPAIGHALVNLGYPGDAMPLFQEALALADAPAPPAGNVRIITEPFNASAVREELDSALQWNGPRRAGRGCRPVHRQWHREHADHPCE